MRIIDLRKERTPGGARVAARVEWEDSERSAVNLFFETDAGAAADLEAAPEALLAACFLPAMRHAERRIEVPGRACPRLAEGLRTAARLLQGWDGKPRRPPRIEPRDGFRAPRPRAPRRSAFFLTGGIDSTQLLGRNRIDYPANHPAAFRDALAVFGLYAPEQIDATNPFSGYARTLDVLRDLAAAQGASLVPIATNVTALDPEVAFIAKESLSSALCAAAHLFSSRWSDISLASGRDVSILVPLGTHPLLDPCWSSGAVEVRHVGIGFTRPERLQEVCESAVGVRRLIVCMAGPPPPHMNCGRCEKCLRTMTALAGHGKLAEAREFPQDELFPADLEAFAIPPHLTPYWRALLPLLRGKRDDLATAVEVGLARAEREGEWFNDTGWKGGLRRLDRQFFGGRLLALRRTISRSR